MMILNNPKGNLPPNYDDNDYLRDPFLDIASKFRGDEFLKLLQVCKKWQRYILSNAMNIESSLKRFVGYTSVFLEEHHYPIQSALVCDLALDRGNGQHCLGAISKETSLTGIDREVSLLIRSVALEILDLDKKDKIEFIKKIPEGFILNQFNHELFLLENKYQDLEFQQNKGAYSTSVKLFIQYAEDLNHKLPLGWKIQFLKKLRYNNETKNAFRNIILYLFKHEFFQFGIYFSKRKKCIEEMSDDLSPFLIEKEVLEHLPSLFNSLKDPKTKGKYLIEVLDKMSDLQIEKCGGLEVIYSFIIILGETYFLTNIGAIAKFILCLASEKNKLKDIKERKKIDEMILAFSLKVGEQNHVYFKQIATCLMKEKYLEEALIFIGRIKNNDTSSRHSLNFLLKELVLGYAEISDYQKASEIVAKMDESRMKSQLRLRIQEFNKKKSNR